MQVVAQEEEVWSSDETESTALALLSEGAAINAVFDRFTAGHAEAGFAGVTTVLILPNYPHAASRTQGSLQTTKSFGIALDPSLVGHRPKFPPPYPSVFHWGLSWIPPSISLAPLALGSLC